VIDHVHARNDATERREVAFVVRLWRDAQRVTGPARVETGRRPRDSAAIEAEQVHLVSERGCIADGRLLIDEVRDDSAESVPMMSPDAIAFTR
jgi:hypothetical protein